MSKMNYSRTKYKILYLRASFVGYPKAKRAKKAQTVLNKFNKIIKQIITFKNHSLPWSISPDYTLNPL